MLPVGARRSALVVFPANRTDYIKRMTIRHCAPPGRMLSDLFGYMAVQVVTGSVCSAVLGGAKPTRGNRDHFRLSLCVHCFPRVGISQDTVRRMKMAKRWREIPPRVCPINSQTDLSYTVDFEGHHSKVTKPGKQFPGRPSHFEFANSLP